ncbi:hypothetical protein E2I00_017261 [Balaenoptera physalus]|uniref:Uncharacterized protein n=1 Tax=Balaenoptera physalus TaxID=9770 RepID=A0A6A1Q1L6_BALPH|nr:hypothetical protein E2I00_017261 [Balaenoptera physalus]
MASLAALASSSLLKIQSPGQ